MARKAVCPALKVRLGAAGEPNLAIKWLSVDLAISLTK